MEATVSCDQDSCVRLESYPHSILSGQDASPFTPLVLFDLTQHPIYSRDLPLLDSHFLCKSSLMLIHFYKIAQFFGSVQAHVPVAQLKEARPFTCAINRFAVRALPRPSILLHLQVDTDR